MCRRIKHKLPSTGTLLSIATQDKGRDESYKCTLLQENSMNKLRTEYMAGKSAWTDTQ